MVIAVVATNAIRRVVVGNEQFNGIWQRVLDLKDCLVVLIL